MAGEQFGHVTAPTMFGRLHVLPVAAIEFAPCPIRPGSSVRHFIGSLSGGIRIEFATPFPG